MTYQHAAKTSLYGRDGRRKYLTEGERRRFMHAARKHPRRDLGMLCLVLAYTGCRISEALALTGASLEPDQGCIAIRSLKKRQRSAVMRQVPVPAPLLRALLRQHDAECPDSKLWSLSRTRAWQLVKAVMADAMIPAGPQATPKGLRHGFGLHAIQSGVPINLVQRWLGHAAMATTAIYLDAVGPEERRIATRMWGR